MSESIWSEGSILASCRLRSTGVICLLPTIAGRCMLRLRAASPWWRSSAPPLLPLVSIPIRSRQSCGKGSGLSSLYLTWRASLSSGDGGLHAFDPCGGCASRRGATPERSESEGLGRQGFLSSSKDYALIVHPHVHSGCSCF